MSFINDTIFAQYIQKNKDMASFAQTISIIYDIANKILANMDNKHSYGISFDRRRPQIVARKVLKCARTFDKMFLLDRFVRMSDLLSPFSSLTFSNSYTAGNSPESEMLTFSKKKQPKAGPILYQFN